ncbi:transglutaminase-like domain-containing protein [candidate division KSB1 bacterium]|nr:transglutaminase-like domain-containing protein [candidate division KSB1 bacterium]
MAKFFVRRRFLVCVFLWCNLACQDIGETAAFQRIPKAKRPTITQALEQAGGNRAQLEMALIRVADERLPALLFLIENMPRRDLRTLSALFLLENIALAERALQKSNWGKDIPPEIFLNYILPYVNLHERRDDWRRDFYEKFMPLVQTTPTAGEAAVLLNVKLWDLINVHYSTRRPKADQSPYESIQAGLASCTGLSILLVDACRAVGIPARFVGVPLWRDHSGNHSWVEIWDQGWHCLGAAEPGPLDQTWFLEKAAQSGDDDPKYGIYAASFQRTRTLFPALWDSTVNYVFAEIVTARYRLASVNDSLVTYAINVGDQKGGRRISVPIVVFSAAAPVDSGWTRSESQDANDRLVLRLRPNQHYQLQIRTGKQKFFKSITTEGTPHQFLNLYLNEMFPVAQP